MKYDITFGVPAIRPAGWRAFYDSACRSVADKTFEVVFVSPYDLPDNMQGLSNVKLIKDFGCPTRCLQISSMHARGELFSDPADDGLFVDGSVSQAIDLYRQKCREQDGIIMKYTEGPGRPVYTPIHAGDQYWTPDFHMHLRRLKGINNGHRWGQFMMKNSLFQDVGGMDCQYRVMNHGMHDLLYRIQNNGGEMHFAPNIVINYDWTPQNAEYSYIQNAANEDWHLLVQHYKRKTNRHRIPFDNWKQSPARWARFA